MFSAIFSSVFRFPFFFRFKQMLLSNNGLFLAFSRRHHACILTKRIRNVPLVRTTRSGALPVIPKSILASGFREKLHRTKDIFYKISLFGKTALDFSQKGNIIGISWYDETFEENDANYYRKNDSKLSG